MLSQLEIIKKASILIEKKNYAKAKDILLEYLRKTKNIKIDIKFYYTMYLAHDGLKEIQEAKKNLEKCLKINEKNYVVLNNLANIFLKEGNIHKAESLYLRSFNIKNDYLLVIVNLAILYQNTGKLESSKEFYLKAIKLSPERISIYFNLSRIDKNFMNEEKIKHISSLMKKEKQELSELSYGYFLLAEHQKKKKNFTEEINYLKKANQNSFNSKKAINSKTLNYWKNIITKKYNNFQFINEDQKTELKNFNPIFIIGLPRSGSTITEALLSSASGNITSLGEASIFNGIIAQGFSNEKEPSVDLNFVQKKILEVFNNKKYNKKNNIFIDKSLENFFYIDVILKVYPKAKFINTLRNIEDNIFAIFKQSLSKISWTHSVENILDYVDNYFKVTNYFIKKYPDKILSIHLEDLTNNTEETSKKLFSFCDLEWSDKILNFYQRENLLISTASNIQIRGNIKKYDKEKYKPYKSLLENFLSKYDWLN